MTCPSDAALLAFASGALEADPRQEIERHLDICPSCLAVVAALAEEASSGSDERDSEPLEGPLLPDGLPRYVPKGEIARGGMGKIFAAEDRLLHRTVALKQTRGRGAAIAKRFVREQRITARLQHPAIIAIYDAGTTSDGAPFFAMRLVSGESLDRVVTKSATLEARLRLLPALISVVDAIAYAHGEGVVHRDLKPQNVLVGAFGEVVVLDWGLAREVGEDAASSGGFEGERDPFEADDLAQTVEGDVMGTPAYMAPEQAEGRQADARSDVYGLGALLYHALSGRPPHERRRANRDEAPPHVPAPPLVSVQPDIPPDLAAIVTRAMATVPTDRYASAADLAEDLKRWQSGRLVEAHQYSPRELVSRFLRRYRVQLVAVTASLIGLLVIGGFSLERVLTERSRALAAQAHAEAARARAETQRAAAENLVGFVLGDLRSKLQRVGRLDVLGGVAGAVAVYQAQSPPAESQGEWIRTSEAAGLAGDVAFTLGDLDAARASYERSLAAAVEADALAPAPAERCRAALRLGDIHKRKGDIPLATSFYEGCVALARGRDSAALREMRVKSAIALAEMARIGGDFPRARRLLEEERKTAIDLVDAAGGPGADVAELLYVLRSDLVQTLFLAGEVAEAMKETEAVAVLARARKDARPDDANARHDYATGQGLLGLVKQINGDLDAAEKLFLEASQIHKELSDSDRSNAQWLRAVSVDADRMGDLESARGRPEKAIAWLTEGRDSAVRILQLAPQNFEWKRDVFISELKVGRQLKDLRRLDEARATLERALHIQEELSLVAPEAGRANRETALVLQALAELELDERRLDEARRYGQRAVEILETQLTTVDTPAVRQDLGSALVLVAKSTKGKEARDLLERARVVIEPIREGAKDNEGLAELCGLVDEGLTKTK